jgi:hypothetical protein
MHLFYDPRDRRFHEERGSQIDWLDDKSAKLFRPLIFSLLQNPYSSVRKVIAGSPSLL